MASDNDLVEDLARIYRAQGPSGVMRNLSFLFGAFVLTGDDGRLKGASEDFCALVGYGHDDLVGRPVWDLVTPDERESLQQRIRRRDEDRYEIKLLDADGVIHHVRVAPRLLTIGEQAIRLAEFVDITELRNALRAARENETKFRSVFELAAVGIGRLKSDGSWLECNAALCSLVGYSEEELTRITFQDITHPDDLDEDLAYVEEMLAAKRRKYSMQKRYIHKQGHVVWTNLTMSLVWDENGEPAYFVSLIDDITELKKAQQQLEYSAESFRGLADSLPIAVAVNDDDGPGSTYRYLNPRFSDMFGYDLDDLANLADWWPMAFPDEEYREAVEDEWMRRARDAAQPASAELPLETVVTCKDGSRKTVRWSFAHRDGTGYAFGLDITAEKKLEESLTEKNAHLEHLSFIDELTSIANRRQFDQSLSTEWRRARRQQANLSLIMIDIDCFKKYNDFYGHVAGDKALKKVASVLAGTLNRGTDLVARYGGEEFAILLPDTSLEDAQKIAEACRERVIAAHIENKPSALGLYLTISLGVASTVPKGDKRAITLVDQADEMLYAAKEQGRNRCVTQSSLANRTAGG